MGHLEPKTDPVEGMPFRLVDVDDLSTRKREAPMPGFDRARANLKPGDGAHVVAIHKDGPGEGFWVEIVSKAPGHGYKVRMVDDLMDGEAVKGQEFVIRFRNINRIGEAE